MWPLLFNSRSEPQLWTSLKEAGLSVSFEVPRVQDRASAIGARYYTRESFTQHLILVCRIIAGTRFFFLSIGNIILLCVNVSGCLGVQFKCIFCDFNDTSVIKGQGGFY